LAELKGMLHRCFFQVKNCIMRYQSTMPLSLIFNRVSRSFQLGKVKYFLGASLLKTNLFYHNLVREYFQHGYGREEEEKGQHQG